MVLVIHSQTPALRFEPKPSLPLSLFIAFLPLSLSVQSLFINYNVIVCTTAPAISSWQCCSFAIVLATIQLDCEHTHSHNTHTIGRLYIALISWKDIKISKPFSNLKINRRPICWDLLWRTTRESRFDLILLSSENVCHFYFLKPISVLFELLQPKIVWEKNHVNLKFHGNTPTIDFDYHKLLFLRNKLKAHWITNKFTSPVESTNCKWWCRLTSWNRSLISLFLSTRYVCRFLFLTTHTNFMVCTESL